MFFFFFKQKTAYEMRISDWSSDVCSSDLAVADMRRARAVKLGIILDRLGQHRGVAVTRDLRAGALKRGEDRRDGAVGIDGDILALEIGERRLERIAVMDAHTVAEMRAQDRKSTRLNSSH